MPNRLVPGDIIILRSGVVAPADCKITDDTQVKVDQSVLTGMFLFLPRCIRGV